MAQDKLDKLRRLNERLSPPEQLGGVFLPVRCMERRFDLMFLAEMPGMTVPTDRPPSENFNFNVTGRDRFLQEMIVKYGAAGSYATDIVKARAQPGRPNAEQIAQWRPHLLGEIEIVQPKAIVVLGRRTYEQSFRSHVEAHIPPGIDVCWVFHYCSQVSKQKFEGKFAEVMSCLWKLQEPS